jgi:hypothetical protein
LGTRNTYNISGIKLQTTGCENYIKIYHRETVVMIQTAMGQFWIGKVWVFYKTFSFNDYINYYDLRFGRW